MYNYNEPDESKVPHTCKTCEFNFSGICAGGDNTAHPYGATITDENDGCKGWGISLEAYLDLDAGR